ncbi:ABC transporter ATP-binding protein [Demequina capsici]|uniref:ABC transporter ATP-binding protein n=1 Tax=Demequina capsici TaxID=3075620 RepID=A0AA96FB62_9MICO|nr:MULTISPECIES: ABC transporter ATP-binding protein [unclassified Demequina]WNM24195.1 ABC transporter ATP-binding protein [Demequina sp. OYTSA14]WNM27024.1 ABC transporter ATP-binding protein [Demequina sp. PMTSA13]
MAKKKPASTPEPDDAVIQVRGVTAVIGETPVLAKVSFKAREGQAVKLLGANGAGKTTLLRVLAGTLKPATGTALVGGYPADEKDPSFRALVTALIGPPPLAHNLTLSEHFALMGLSWGLSTEEAIGRGGRVLDAFGVGALASRFPHELSSGQQQMAALALTLTRPADIILLDEPEQRLDADRVGVLAALLEEERDDGATLVVASHSVALREALTGPTVTLTEVRTSHAD